MRASPGWQAWMQSQGIDPAGPIRLNERQRRALQQHLRGLGIELPRGTEIDPAGNVNESDNGVFEKRSVRIGLAAGAALLTAGAAGWGPLAGVFGQGGAATGAAGATSGINAGVGTLGTAGAPGGAFYGATAPAVSRGISAGLGARDWLGLALFGGQTVADLWGADRNADAADRMAAAELEAQRLALQLLREQWEYDKAWQEDERRYRRESFAPYLAAGQNAANRLDTLLMGQTPRPLPAAVEARVGTAPQTTMGNFGRTPPVIDLSARPDGTWGPQPVPTPQPRQQQPLPGGVPTMATFGQPPQEPVSTTMPAPAGAGPTTVLMEAPTGERKAVPASKVAMFEAKGARRIDTDGSYQRTA